MDQSSISSVSTRKLSSGDILSTHYKIISHIADGGMASVYKAIDLRNGIDSDPIAIKILHHSLINQVTHVERFIQEAKLLSAIHHPMVVELLDIGQSENYVYLCMPYIEAPTLAELIDNQGIPVQRLAKLIISICEGLSALHKSGIIHRDIKPANILVLNDYSVKITDLGIARIKESKLTQPKQKVGSLAYIPPEIWMGEESSPAQDFYALGVCLYEVTTHTNPFESELAGEVMKLHLNKTPLDPRIFSNGIPVWTSQLIMWMLNKKPSKRPKNAEEIILFITKNVSSTSNNGELLSSSSLETIKINNKLRTHKRNKTYIFSLSAPDFSAKFKKVDNEDSIKRIKPRSPTVLISLPRNSAFVFEFEPPSRDVIAAGLLLASMQVLDGYLTSRGISHLALTQKQMDLSDI